MKKLEPFKEPIYITRPLLPDPVKMDKKIREIWKAKQLTNRGPMHRFLEERLCDYLKVPALSLFNNGTIAMIVGIQALRLSGEVITTPFTFPATVHVLNWNNIRPIFCDIDYKTMNIDSERIESLITPQTTAILGVHVFGIPCDTEGIQAIADKYGLKVIYDGAHAFGMEYKEKSIGSFGDITMFSFHATKLFHTAEGGALTYRDPNSKPRIEFLKNFGIKNEDEVVMPGINGKMNEIQAALGLLVLDMVEKECEKRKKLFEVYRVSLSEIEGIELVALPDNVTPSYQYCILRIDKEKLGRSRDQIYLDLKKFNVFTRKYFFPLCSDYPCYKYLPSSASSNLPNARKIVDETLALPFYGGLEITDVERICDMIKELRR